MARLSDDEQLEAAGNTRSLEDCAGEILEVSFKLDSIENSDDLNGLMLKLRGVGNTVSDISRDLYHILYAAERRGDEEENE